MKILYLSDSYIPSRAANSVHVMKMCEALADCGHEVTLVGLRASDQKVQEDVFQYYGVKKCFSLQLNGIRPLKGRLVLHAIRNVFHIRSLNPDIVFGRSFLSIALCALFFRRRLGLEIHTPYSQLTFMQRLAFIVARQSLTLIVVISESLKEIQMRELGPDFPVPILALHDGATVPELEDTKPHRVLDLTEAKLNIGYVGSVQKGRGIEEIVRLSSLLPDFNFHIVGGTLPEVQALVGATVQPPNLTCHGYVSPTDANSLRYNFDIVLAPYQKKTLIKSGHNTSGFMSPLKIFEYMASKRAIIASDLPVLREVLQDNVNAVLVPPNDIGRWKDAIVRLSNLHERERLAERAYQDFITKYTWKKRAEQILKSI